MTEDQPMSTKARRRRWYSLLAILVIALISGLYVVTAERARKRDWAEANRHRGQAGAARQREAVLALTGAGAWVQYDFQVGEWVGKTPPDTRPPEIARLHEHFGIDMFTDVIGVFPGPRAGPRDFGITDADLSNLDHLPQLQRLDLSTGTRVTDAGLVHFAGLTQLRSLNLAYTNVTDAGLVHIKGLSQLRDLSLGHTNVSGPGLVHTKTMKNLQFLSLAQTPILDTGLEHIKDLKQLCVLYLGHTAVSDSGLRHLRALTQLQELDLICTSTTADGIADLQQALPDCAIKR
jgi:hypothetical protein